MTYAPNWDVDRARGEEAEGLFRQLRSEIASGEAEVKRDDRARDTGNFYVEYECRRRDGWHPSGLATTKAKLWVIYAAPAIVAVPVDVLKTIARTRWRNGDRLECVVGSHPTRGVAIPIRELLPAALTVHGTAQGAPTDEPPAAAPHDADPDAARDELPLETAGADPRPAVNAITDPWERLKAMAAQPSVYAREILEATHGMLAPDPEPDFTQPPETGEEDIEF